MILSDHNLYTHWFGYYFPLHSGPCDSLNYLGHFKMSLDWLIDWYSVVLAIQLQKKTNV